MAHPFPLKNRFGNRIDTIVKHAEAHPSVLQDIKSMADFLIDEPIREVFLANCEIAFDKTEKNATRRLYLDSAVLLYLIDEQLQAEFEYRPEELRLVDRLVRRDRKVLMPLDDGINYNAPEDSGLYLIGQTYFNPITDEKYYCVKIGRADKLNKRLGNYNTHCPMLWRIDYKIDAEEEEEYYQQKLYNFAYATCSHNKEWFYVDRETYLEICNKGFSYFN